MTICPRVRNPLIEHWLNKLSAYKNPQEFPNPGQDVKENPTRNVRQELKRRLRHPLIFSNGPIRLPMIIECARPPGEPIRRHGKQEPLGAPAQPPEPKDPEIARNESKEPIKAKRRSRFSRVAPIVEGHLAINPPIIAHDEHGRPVLFNFPLLTSPQPVLRGEVQKPRKVDVRKELSCEEVCETSSFNPLKKFRRCLPTKPRIQWCLPNQNFLTESS